MTREEVIKILQNIYFEVPEIKEALQIAIETLSRSSLSSNLDEVAKKLACTVYPPYYEMPDDNWKERAGYVKGFKTGAEWMAGQGYTTEKTVDRTPFNGPAGICLNLHDSTGFKIGDKVIVQVRKKQ